MSLGRGVRAVRLAGGALLLGALTAWVVAGTPGLGDAAFGTVPSDPAPVVETSSEPEASEEPDVADVEGRTLSDELPVTPPASPFTTTAPRGAIDPTTWPRGVRIPRLGVDAPVLAVGHDTVGALIVPHSPMDVGWYQGGSVPGEPGVALLTSHVDTRTEGRGVFAGLVDLAEGDPVTVTAADGTEQQWTVTARTQHDKNDLPRELFARSGAPVLALVTCGGPFDREARSYRDNVIVWAERTSG